MFPPINPHSRPPSEDLRGVTTNGSAEMHSAAKQQQIRRQQTIENQRRSPLRSNSLLPSTASRYVTAAAAAAAATAVPSPSVSVSPLVRSPSFVQNGPSAQFEPAKSELDVTISESTANTSFNTHLSILEMFILFSLIKMKKHARN